MLLSEQGSGLDPAGVMRRAVKPQGFPKVRHLNSKDGGGGVRRGGDSSGQS